MSFRITKDDFGGYVHPFHGNLDDFLKEANDEPFQEFFQTMMDCCYDQTLVNKEVSLQPEKFVKMMYFIILSESFKRSFPHKDWAANIGRTLSRRLIDDFWA
jgi:hypothetical protein